MKNFVILNLVIIFVSSFVMAAEPAVTIPAQNVVATESSASVAAQNAETTVSIVESDAESTQLPNLSMIQAAAFMEVLQVLSRPGNKLYWLCGQDIVKKIQHPNSVQNLSPECRSELNRVMTKDNSGSSEEVTALAVQITNGKISNRDKLTAIYEWVTENISYDVETYTDLIKNGKILQYPLKLVSPIETLKSKKALAEGYSLLTAALLRAVNIPAVTIIGAAKKENKIQGLHAWNEAYIDDQWINLDTTWDAGKIKGNLEEGLTFISHPTKKYLAQPTSDFKKTHSKHTFSLL